MARRGTGAGSSRLQGDKALGQALQPRASGAAGDCLEVANRRTACPFRRPISVRRAPGCCCWRPAHPWEYAATLAAMPWLNRLPPGDGHPVIVYPGLGASEQSTQPLRSFLAQRGHAVYDWGLGHNRPRAGLMEECRHRLQAVAARGMVARSTWSAGAWAASMRASWPSNSRRRRVASSRWARRSRAMCAPPMWPAPTSCSAAPRCATTRCARAAAPCAVGAHRPSIYSRSDGVVAWQCSLNEHAPHTENIEIHASHLGLGVNPLALYAVARQPRQDPATWQRFDPPALPRWFFRGRPAHSTKAQH